MPRTFFIQQNVDYVPSVCQTRFRHRDTVTKRADGVSALMESRWEWERQTASKQIRAGAQRRALLEEGGQEQVTLEQRTEGSDGGALGTSGGRVFKQREQ